MGKFSKIILFYFMGFILTNIFKFLLEFIYYFHCYTCFWINIIDFLENEVNFGDFKLEIST